MDWLAPQRDSIRVAKENLDLGAILRRYRIYRPFIALGQILTAIGVMRDKTGAFEVVLAR
jgi:hypothetical protein